jgi:predicted ATPase
MKVHSLEIKGFRGIQSGIIHFGDFTVLIGQNNSGKTTIIEALALLLGRDKLVRTLTEHDFWGSTPEATSRIQIIATISGFTPNDPARHTQWFRSGRGVPKWICANTGQVKAVSGGANDQLACQIAFAARFDSETLEVDTCRYFYDDSAPLDPFDESSALTALPVALFKEMGFFLVPASRTWDRMISFGSELFRRVVAYTGGNPAEAVLKERDRLRSPTEPLEADAKIKSLVDAISADLKSLFGRQSDLKLRLTSTDSEGVLDAVFPHFAEDGGIALPSRRHGNGLISLQTLVLLMRFGSLRVAKNENFLMAIEEPELHVPPPQQRKLLHLMQTLTTQAIITSHSPAVAAMAPPHQLVLVSNAGGTLRAIPLLAKQLDTSATNLERGLFLSDRDVTVAAIMHRRVMIPEGKLDARWFRLLSRLADISVNTSSSNAVDFTHEVGVIPTRDAQVVRTFDLLQKVHPSIICLVDGDAAGSVYANQLAALPAPPANIIQWPSGWVLEDVVSWIVEADPTVLTDTQLVAAGVPVTVPTFLAALKIAPLKGDDVIADLIADAISTKAACMKRVRHLLQVIADIAAGRAVDTAVAVPTVITGSTAKLWTFKHAVPGL